MVLKRARCIVCSNTESVYTQTEKRSCLFRSVLRFLFYIAVDNSNARFKWSSFAREVEKLT